MIDTFYLTLESTQHFFMNALVEGTWHDEIRPNDFNTFTTLGLLPDVAMPLIFEAILVMYLCVAQQSKRSR